MNLDKVSKDPQWISCPSFCRHSGRQSHQGIKLEIVIIVIFIHFHSLFIHFSTFFFVSANFQIWKFIFLIICFLFKDVCMSKNIIGSPSLTIDRRRSMNESGLLLSIFQYYASLINASIDVFKSCKLISRVLLRN